MREILFRGKRPDNVEWVHGSFCMDAVEQFNGVCGVDGFIRLYEKTKGKMQMHEVDRETVGQYTGLKDKNGKQIFEGDILSIPFEEDRSPYEENSIYYEKGEVYFDTERYGWYVRFREYNDEISLWEYDNTDIEAIGNIYDNPELLKGGNQ